VLNEVTKVVDVDVVSVTDVAAKFVELKVCVVVVVELYIEVAYAMDVE
jgi:hypothetical protein